MLLRAYLAQYSEIMILTSVVTLQFYFLVYYIFKINVPSTIKSEYFNNDWHNKSSGMLTCLSVLLPTLWYTLLNEF